MKVTVEFYGRTRRLTKTAEVEIDIGKVIVTLRDVAVALAKTFPELLSKILSSETFEPLESYKFNINGKYVAQNLDVNVKNGDKILLMPIEAGG